MQATIRDDQSANRYEMDVDGQTVFATYRREGDNIHILHVEAPPALRGTGAAGRFMQALVQRLREERLRAVPVCSYAAVWIARHRETL